MKIYAITNQKGGVGKTTTAMNLAAGLGKHDKKVLLLDLDAQANSTHGLGVEKDDVDKDLFDVLVNGEKIDDVVIDCSAQNVKLVPATINLAGAEIYLSHKDQGSSSESIFTKKFNEMKEDYDYVIMDCPPSLGLVNRNALTAADATIIPVQTEYYALEGLTQLLSTISITKKTFNKKLQIEGILLTMYTTQNNLSKEVEAEVNKFFGEKVFETKIPKNVKLAEAPSAGKSIFDYDPSAKGAKAYDDFTKEILKINGDK